MNFPPPGQPNEYNYKRMAEVSQKFRWMPAGIRRFLTNKNGWMRFRQNVGAALVFGCIAFPTTFEVTTYLWMGKDRYLSTRLYWYDKYKYQIKYGKNLYIPLLGTFSLMPDDEIEACERLEAMMDRQRMVDYESGADSAK